MPVFSNLRDHDNKETHRTSFHVSGIDLSIVNGLRRTILTDIPTIGFVFEGEPSMSVETNTGPLHNEFVLHRMSMVPIHLSEEEVEEFVPNSYIFELEKKNTTDMTINVTTHDIRVVKNNEELSADKVRALFPVNSWSKQPILITRLRTKEHIHLYGNFVKSTSRENAGFSPVSLCTFVPDQDTDMIKQQNIKNVLDKERAFIKNDYGDPVSWSFEIESENGMTVPYIVSKAFGIIRKKLEDVLENLTTDNVEYIENDIPGTFEYVFTKEDDTIGNIIQSFFHNEYYRTKKLIHKEYQLTYVGYYCPHPLDAKVNVRMTLNPVEGAEVGSASELMVRNFFKDGMHELLEQMEEYHEEWDRFSGRPVAKKNDEDGMNNDNADNPDMSA